MTAGPNSEPPQQFPQPHLGRREYDTLEVIDTENILTKEELKELKQLAQLSKTSKMFVIAVLAVVSFLGLPTVVSWFNSHFHW